MEKITPTTGIVWPHNLAIMRTSLMEDWLKEKLGHGDCFKRGGVWLLAQTEKPLGFDPLYFFWGPGAIQFKHEDDMVAFILRFAGD